MRWNKTFRRCKVCSKSCSRLLQIIHEIFDSDYISGMCKSYDLDIKKLQEELK